MGLLSLDNGTTFNLNKATVSLWFRIPQATLDIVAPPTSFYGYEVFNGVIPIIVFGKQLQGPTSSAETMVIGEVYIDGDRSRPQKVFGSVNRVRTAPVQPSLIGVVKRGSSAILFVHLQTADLGNNANTNQDTTGFVPLVNDLGVPYGVHQYTGVDASYADNKLEFISGYAEVEMTPDAWHHLLISWDIGSRNASHGTATVDSSIPIAAYVDARSTLYCALDDRNLTKFDLPALWVGGGANDVICDGGFTVAGRTMLGISGDVSKFSVDFNAGISVNAIYVPADSISYQRDPGPPWGVPVSSTETGNVIQKVELAELQLFTNLVINTSDESKRRAFIDFERDENGNKVLDNHGKGTLLPVKPKKTEELLFRRPDILLHGTSNWKAGKNTGSTGLLRHDDEPDEMLPAGQFDPTGTIRKYTPDPALGEA